MGIATAAACQPLGLPAPARELVQPPPAGSPIAVPSRSPQQVAPNATRGDGLYTPVSNVDVHQAIMRDVADIDQLLTQATQGRALPAAEIMSIYEKGRHARTADGTWSLQGFATSAVRSREFPEDAGFYGSEAFLDEPLRSAIAGTGSAAAYGVEQRRQAIQKGLLRIARYWSLHELTTADAKLRAGQLDDWTDAAHDVDAAWAIYVGPEAGSPFPSSLAAAARQLEDNYGRPATADLPLRAAMARAQQAALRNDRRGFQEARLEATGRLNAIFYLEVARDLTEMARAAQAGNSTGAANVQVAGLSAYLAIQPTVAIADSVADRTVLAIFRGDSTGITLAHRDEALDALNRVAPALGLTRPDLVLPAEFR
jgi:hypothetical protein